VRIQQPGPVRVFTNCSQDRSHRTFDRLKIDLALADRSFYRQSGVRVAVDSIDPDVFCTVYHD